MNWLLICGWAFYFFLHSFLASMQVKNYFSITCPSLVPYYRIIYNFIALLGLGILLPFSISIELYSSSQIIGSIVSVIGIIFVWLAFRSFNIREFLGFQSESQKELVVTGMYRFVRHPLYFGIMILIAGLYLLFPSENMLITLLVTYTYIWIGSRLEERKLRVVYGESYTIYAQKVKSLIPYVY